MMPLAWQHLREVANTMWHFWYLESAHNSFLESLLCFLGMWQGLMMTVTGVWGLPCFLCIRDYNLYADFIAVPCFLRAAIRVLMVRRKEEGHKLTEFQRSQIQSSTLETNWLLENKGLPGIETWVPKATYLRDPCVLFHQRKPVTWNVSLVPLNKHKLNKKNFMIHVNFLHFVAIYYYCVRRVQRKECDFFFMTVGYWSA